MPSFRAQAALSASLFACASCAPSVEFAQVEPVSSLTWSNSEPAPTAAEAGVPASLASLLASPQLGDLVARARQRNTDLSIAEARVSRASALLDQARMARLPSVGVNAGASRSFGVGSSSGALDFRSAFASLDLAVDLDPFGRLDAARKAQVARAEAARIERAAVDLAVETDVAQAFVLRAALAGRITILDRTIERAAEMERIVRLRNSAGAATRVELGQQSIRLMDLRRNRTELVEALDATRTALALLCGEEAPLFTSTPADIDAIALPALVPVAPVQLLATRPDIRAREALIAAATGDVRAARAAFFPSLSLSVSGLLADTASGPLGKSVTIGSSLLGPIFDRGRLGAQLKVASADQVASVEEYRHAVLSALVEVENLNSSVRAARERASLVQQLVVEARTTARLARAQYVEGEEDLWTEIDAQELLAGAEDALVLSRQEQILAQIALYRALGGLPAAR